MESDGSTERPSLCASNGDNVKGLEMGFEMKFEQKGEKCVKSKGWKCLSELAGILQAALL